MTDQRQISDFDLVQQIAAGNDFAFAKLYEKHWDVLFIAAFKVLKDEEVAKDIVQELFLEIWEKSILKEVSNVRAYLLRAVRFKTLMALRRNKISDKHLESVTELVANTTEELLDFEELNEVINSSINDLPQKCQEVFRMSRMDHLSNKEIAVRLNISVRTVETHISNALRSIRSQLDNSVAFFVIFMLNF